MGRKVNAIGDWVVSDGIIMFRRIWIRGRISSVFYVQDIGE